MGGRSVNRNDDGKSMRWYERLLDLLREWLAIPPPPPRVPPTPEPEPAPIEPTPQPTLDDIPADQITWTEAPEVRDWPIDATITSLSVDTRRGRVTLVTTPKRWPLRDHPSGPGGMGNWWMIAKVNGAWHAATFEWLGAGRTQSGFPQQFDPDKADPKRLRGKLSHWVPQKGETVGFCQTTYARDRVRTSNKRTNIRTVTWP